MTDTKSTLITQTIKIDGIWVRYCVHRCQSINPPLLVFNGIGASIELLSPFIDAMANTTIISYDSPGTGKSNSPSYPWRPRRHCALAAELVRKLGFEVVDVLGVSWGGMLAQQFAYQYPSMCRRLVLAATSPGQIMVPSKLAVMLRMSNPLRYLVPSYMEAIAGDIYGGSLRTNKLGVKRHSQRMRPPSIRGYFYQMASIIGWSSLPWLCQLRQDTLVLAGDDDPIIPLINARLLAALIPNARLRVVHCGHLFLITRASIISPEIEAFLSAPAY